MKINNIKIIKKLSPTLINNNNTSTSDENRPRPIDTKHLA